MISLSFEAKTREDGEFIRLLRNGVAVSFDDWSTQVPTSAVPVMARLMQAWADNEYADDGRKLIEPDSDGVFLHPAFVASLSDGESISIGLPATTKLSLSLQSQGLVHTPDFRINMQWTRPNGLPAAVQIQGARVKHETRDWRIPEPLWSVFQACQSLNQADSEPNRYMALAKLRTAIGDEFEEQIKADGYLERLRLSYAAGFSLDLHPSASGFDFDPVLFGKDSMTEAESGIVLDQEADMLLPPIQQADFAKRFRRGDGSRRAYLLEDGSMLFLDPALKTALAVVRKAQSGTVEERRKFASNPRRILAEALANDGATAAMVADLFIETQQFSERISGIDIWRKPVLPWIKPKPNSWLPEKFGLRIGNPPDELMVEIEPQQIAPLLEATQLALREERASFDFEGIDIPATVQTQQALSELSELLEASQKENTTNQPPATLGQRYFLQVRDNLEDVAYAPIGQETLRPLVPAIFPAIMRSAPKPHQIDGFNWLSNCWQRNIPGALLADDMGLGKTYQAISFMAWLRENQKIKQPILIIAPTGLLANWRTEINLHVGEDNLGRVVNAYGKDLARARDGNGRDIDMGSANIRPEAWSDAGIVLTTFETMRDYHLSFARQPFAAIIYDEVQKLKNPASQMTRAAKTLNARFQLAMTGTPVENRLQDLWSIFDVIHPGLLSSSKAFEAEYPSTDHIKLKALHDVLALPQGQRPPLLLRRMKDDCLPGLPKKHIERMPVNMPQAQALSYNHVIQRAMAARASGQRGYMLEILHLLRGVSLHPRNPEEANLDPDYFTNSARLVALFTILDKVYAKKEKVLIFCESLAMQALVALEIERHYRMDHPIPRIHGGVTGELRQRAVEIFQQRDPGFDAMILSPKAGGVGLTLTAANHVIHLSRWWNPAVEDQATDRVFRMGQNKDVTVYLPQAVHPDASIRSSSFDLKLDELMKQKRALSRGFLIPGESDSDTNTLFDSLFVETPIEAEPENKKTPLVDIIAPLTDTAPGIPTSNQWPQFVQYYPQQQRNHEIFKKPIANEHIISLEIRDPYACASPDNRNCIIEFVQIFRGAASRLDQVNIICFDGDSCDRNETNTYQRSDIEARWAQRMSASQKLKLNVRSKRQHRHFHDRYITAKTATGKKFVWDTSNGIDGIIKPFKECRVILTEQ